ncbi:MAG TPA: ATP-binding protein [Pyrinomonadaceae bacterium]|nr:ATP-binding protein [Pyrinomonadaceae bacterium]
MDANHSEFLVEIEELVEHIFADLDELRATRTEGRARRELIDRIFRRVHSVKGSAASCGLAVVNQIAHEFENLLSEVRAGRVAVDDDLVDTCERATDALSESLTLAESGIVEPSRRELFDRLQAAANKQAAVSDLTESEQILKNIPFEIWESLSDSEKQRLITIVAEGSPLLVATASFAIASFDAEFSRLQEKLREFGEVISTSPTVDENQPGKINFRVLYASDNSPQDIVAGVADLSEVQVSEIVESGIETKTAVAVEVAAPAPSVATISLTNFVRTDLDKLDKLISSTHELLRTTSAALDQAIAKQGTGSVEELQNLTGNIRRSFMGLEDELINLRLVPLGPTLQRALRAGRAAARLSGKEIEFEIAGADIRVDKLLVEAIADPLIHLVRNAVDHGIETVEERARAGKSQRGTVRIEALNEGSQSRLRVTDDGRGVDAAAVSEAAQRLGIPTGELLQLDMERSLRLIFRPGFTTMKVASETSGRGVGLDIVETSVEQVGGELRVSTEPGQRTTFEIRLPVTFGLVTTNVVVSDGSRYCIPAAQTLGIDNIDLVDGSSGANQLRQFSLRDLLGQAEDESEETARALQLITCQYMDERSVVGQERTKIVGIVVDRVEGPQEVLVRTLGRHSGRWYGIAGATELNDGTVALVLDLPRLLSGA